MVKHRVWTRSVPLFAESIKNEKKYLGAFQLPFSTIFQNANLLETICKVNVPITDNQLMALSSFSYNVGKEAFATSTLLELLNSGADINTVADQFDRWTYSGGVVNKGLTARRAAEKALFLS